MSDDACMASGVTHKLCLKTCYMGMGMDMERCKLRETAAIPHTTRCCWYGGNAERNTVTVCSVRPA